MTDNLTPRTPASLRGVVRSAVTGRRTRAVLAGGVVLGLGATATLAAYSDSEWASGTFTAAAVTAEVLELEGSKDGSGYGSAVALKSEFDMTKMVKGATYYAPLYVRTTAATTVDADVTIPAPAVGGSTALANKVSVAIIQSTNSTCDAQTPGSNVGGGTTLGAAASTQTVRITAGPAGATDAATVLCFQFTLTERPAGTAPLAATATWTVTATQAP